MVAKTIYLVRHGTTEWIEQGHVHGALDSPLSKFGEWEAQQAAGALLGHNITHIFSSPQGRAMQTAGFIAEKLPAASITPLEGLREMGFGFMEGKPDLYKKYSRFPFLFIFIAPVWHAMLGFTGEKRADLHSRVLNAWQRILAHQDQGNIVVVSHALAINVILTTLPCGEGMKKRERYHLGTCSISEVRIDEEGKATLAVINNTTHLQEKEAV
ncbi:MAG TPA: histidine phosphatase family protein [Anaerolineaceae bacterium]|nr:histidine phosphatase family protein [Anaerolineaceae bacterium]